MKKTGILAATAGLLAIGTPLAQAQEAQRYDKSIEAAATERVAKKIGDLRGLIEANSDDQLIRLEDLQPKQSSQNEISYPQPYRKAWEKQPDMPSLPPMVNNFQRGQDGVDPVITTGALKFDSRGRPIAHHQDTRHLTPGEIGGYVLKALKLNPYPGDR